MTAYDRIKKINLSPLFLIPIPDEPKAVSYTDQSKTPVFHNNSAQHKGGKPVCVHRTGRFEIMRFLYPKYRRNRLTAQRAGGGYNDQSNYCSVHEERMP